MKNVFYYLFYELYQVAKKSSLKDIPIFYAVIIFSSLIGINLMTIIIFFEKVNFLPRVFAKNYYGGIFMAIILTISMLFFNKKRVKIIQNEFSVESVSNSKKGFMVIIIYIIISFLLLFLIPLYATPENLNRYDN
jgi:hypothetical protein